MKDAKLYYLEFHSALTKRGPGNIGTLIIAQEPKQAVLMLMKIHGLFAENAYDVYTYELITRRKLYKYLSTEPHLGHPQAKPTRYYVNRMLQRQLRTGRKKDILRGTALLEESDRLKQIFPQPDTHAVIRLLNGDQAELYLSPSFPPQYVAPIVNVSELYQNVRIEDLERLCASMGLPPLTFCIKGK